MNDETVIIGGGPAGSTAAILLARKGMPVRLLERQTGSHHKVCGEFISYEAAHHLQAMGLDLPALGAVPIRQVRFYNGEQSLAFALPFSAWSLSRCVLDEALLTLAEKAGAAVEMGVVVNRLSRTSDGWLLHVRHHSAPSYASNGISAKTVFLASGKHELRGWPRHATKKAISKINPAIKPGVDTDHQFIGFKMHFRPGSSLNKHWKDTVYIHLFDGGYAGLEPIEQGAVNFCFLITQDIYKASGSNWTAVLEWLRQQSPHVYESLADLTPCWPEPLAVAGIPYGYISTPHEAQSGLFRLGDQAAVIPSFAGDGIAIAVHTATLAARIHNAGGNSSLYQRQASKILTSPVRNAKRLSDIFASNTKRNIAFRLALLSPAFLRKRLLQELFLRTRMFNTE